MTTRKLNILVVTHAVVLLCGCGTINNMIVGTPPAPPHEYTPPLEVYGGVRSDFREAQNAVMPPYSESLGENGLRMVEAAMLLGDIPFSVIGDTLTLGKTIPASIERQKASR